MLKEPSFFGQAHPFVLIAKGSLRTLFPLRIETLVEQILQKVDVDDSGWDTLFRDSEDGRYWELTYPHSSWDGGGPPRLTYLSPEEARAKYRDV